MRIWRILAGAFLAATVAILINVVSADFIVPRQYYLAILAVLVVLITVAAFFDHAGERLPRAQNMVRKPGASGRPPQVLQGKRQRKSGAGAALTSILGYFGGLFCIALGDIFLIGNSRVARNLIAGPILLGLGIALFVWAILLLIGVRTRLEFFDEGIVLRNAGGAFFIGWDEATNFRTFKPGWLTTYLVADPLPGSAWYTGPWTYDEKNQVIRICDLTDLNIPPGNVSFALTSWDPSR